MMSETIRVGASFVMALRPIGLMESSPHVCRRYVADSHSTLTFTPVAAMLAAGTRMTKPRPAPTRPSANFVGTLGSMFFILIQSHAKIGAKRMMNAEFSDWNQL